MIRVHIVFQLYRHIAIVIWMLNDKINVVNLGAY